MKAWKAEGETFCFLFLVLFSNGVEGGVRTWTLDILNLRYLLDIRWKCQKNSWIWAYSLGKKSGLEKKIWLSSANTKNMKSRDRMISPRQEVRQEDQRQSFGVIQNLQVREKKTNWKKFKSWPVKYEKNQGKWCVPKAIGMMSSKNVREINFVK